MFETRDEIAELARLFDATPVRGIRHVAFATVSPKGEPRVSPLDSIFIHGRFTLGTSGEATRVRHLRANRACSAVHLDGDRIAVVVNGTVEWIDRGHPDHDEIQRAWTSIQGVDPYSLGPDVVLFRVAPASMWAYASNPGEFPAE